MAGKKPTPQFLGPFNMPPYPVLPYGNAPVLMLSPSGSWPLSSLPFPVQHVGQMGLNRQRGPKPSTSSSIDLKDMDSLKKAIGAATPGTGEVKRIIKSASFKPRAAAFTSLLQLCARSRDWQKAEEVFEAMRETPDVKLNTISYSALISALSSGGQWEKALAVLSEMEKAAKTSPECAPNTVTYSSIISACERGDRLDLALESYAKMVTTEGIRPDLIAYSAIVSACEKKNMLHKCVEALDAAHADGYTLQPATYNTVLSTAAKLRKWHLALELFLDMQLAGAEPNRQTLAALMAVFEVCDRVQEGMELMRGALLANYQLDAMALMSLLNLLAKHGDWQDAMEVYAVMQDQGVLMSPAACSALVVACDKGGNLQLAEQLRTQFRGAGWLARQDGGAGVDAACGPSPHR